MKIHLREMTPADLPAVRDKLREQNERDGTSYGLPRIFDERGVRLPGVALALVAVNEEGAVLQGHVWERTLEQMSFGTDARATVASIREQDAVYWLLRQRGYKDVHVLVPQPLVTRMGHGLETILKLNDTGMRHFYRLLDPNKNDELREWHRSSIELSRRIDVRPNT